MITRYSRPEMAALWSEDRRGELWLRIELLALEQMAREGTIPRDCYEAVRDRGAFDLKRMDELERELQHDIIAFLTTISEAVGPESRVVHRGMTSSDLIDTATGVQLMESGKLLTEALVKLRETVYDRANEERRTPCIGRSHGIHAEPITFGVKLLGWVSELKRHERRLEFALEDVRYGKISGPVGTFGSLSPTVEQFVLESLGLKPEPVSTQVVPRDRHAFFLQELALLATSLERISVEIRHLQRTEVHEVEEPFGKGQKGSSAMPHKKNPILTENLCGLARLVRGYASAAMDNVVLWHERDISHSSAERVILPDSCILVHFMLHRLTGVVRNLVVLREQMLHNVERTRGMTVSGHILVALTDKGVSREDAYRVVQRHALPTLEGGPDLRERLLADPEVVKTLGEKEIESLFDLTRYAAHVDFLFDRVEKL